MTTMTPEERAATLAQGAVKLLEHGAFDFGTLRIMVAEALRAAAAEARAEMEARLEVLAKLWEEEADALGEDEQSDLRRRAAELREVLAAGEA